MIRPGSSAFLAPDSAAWNSDGTIVFASDERSALSRVSASGGTPQPLTTLNAQRRDVSHRYPSFLPDGRHFVFLVWAGDVDRAGIYLGDLDGDVAIKRSEVTEPALFLPRPPA